MASVNFVTLLAQRSFLYVTRCGVCFWTVQCFCSYINVTFFVLVLWQHTCFRFRSFLAAPRLSYLHVGFIPIRLNIPWLCWADLGIGLLSCAVLLDMLAHHLDSCMRQIHSVRRPLLVCIRHAGDIEAGDRHAHLRLWIDRLIVLTRPVFHTS